MFIFFFFSSRRRHTRLQGDWSSDVCSSDLRFQLYNRTVMMMPQRFKTVILATFILHNFIEKTRRTDYCPLQIQPEWIRRRRNRASANNVPLNPPLWYGCHRSQQAIEVRNTYTRLFHAERET